MSTAPPPIKSRPPPSQPITIDSGALPGSQVGSPLSDSAGDLSKSPTNDTGSLLSKTYVIPPRPKPGRKPATDTPQTKRKEQNREAQRAFRERRAARVGELEEELAQKSAAWAERETSLEQALQNQQRAFQRDVQALQAQYNELERALNSERRLRSQVEADLQTIRKNNNRYSASSITSYPSGGSTPFSKGATSSSGHEHLAYQPSQPSSRTDTGRLPLNKDAFDPTCDRCSQGGQCACLDQALARHTNFSPKDEVEPMEIDFTTATGTARNQQMGSTTSGSNTKVLAKPSQYAPHDATPSNEPCGFCTDNQNCVCNAYREQARSVQEQSDEHPNLPPIQGPGTCDRCQQDPERRRFCQMLAKSPPLTSPAASVRNTNMRLPSIDERMSMSCNQAYDTLSQDPALHDKRNSLSFISQLRARPAESTKHGADGINATHTSALEVDIASMLAAMREKRIDEEQRRSARSE